MHLLLVALEESVEMPHEQVASPRRCPQTNWERVRLTSFHEVARGTVKQDAMIERRR
jgi:hypothetical protein